MEQNTTQNMPIEQGWTQKMYKWYSDTIEKENGENCFDESYRQWAHAHGFYAESACSYNLTPQSIGEYLSDHDYLKVWPLNGWTRIWINDKLTLKYMLANTMFDKLMPEYYYYSTPQGLRPLVDNPYKSQGSDEDCFLRLLKEKGDFACKPCNGTTAIGFVRLSFKDGEFFFNHDKVSSEEIVAFIHTHPNYVFTEYLKPSKDFSRFSEQIHTLRIVTLNVEGQARIVGGYLRLPCHTNGEANYTVIDGSDTESFNLFVNVDFNTGRFEGAKKTFANRVEACSSHPDTGALIEGTIPSFDALREIVLSVANRFNTLEWLGFDIGITDKGPKCMEINSHPGIKYMQIFTPLLQDELLKSYFSQKLSEIEHLSKDELERRFRIPR
jgi:hypothetical protein